ncbi:MAG TPA: ATP-binding protein [Ardenticatenaceae bacterium]|jgi:predicted kinase
MGNVLLVLISGLPCTGKTRLGKRLADDLRLPFVNKDGIKETLFDAMGWSDREWSKRLGGASYDLLFYFIECQLRAGRSLVAESNFYSDHAQRLLELKQRYPFEPFQIECRTNGEVLLKRFKARSGSGERHPGHVDHLNLEEFTERLLQGRGDPIEIGGTHLVVDTTDFAAIQYEALLDALRAAL